MGNIIGSEGQMCGRVQNAIRNVAMAVAAAAAVVALIAVFALTP